jgi:Right handed beta helix region
MRYLLLLLIICCQSSVQVTAGEHAPPRRMFVATVGNDEWSGSMPKPNAAETDGPFATLERARDAIRELKKESGLPPGGITVELQDGAYERERPFELSANDSGRADAPIVYRGSDGADVRIVGGKRLTGWTVPTEPSVRERLDESARGQVLQVNLSELGMTDYGHVNEAGLELIFHDEPMMLARWPNDGFVQIVDTAGGEPVDVRGTKGDKIGKFIYDGDRPRRWTKETDVWLHGYWFWDWSDQRQKVQSIDVDRRLISLVPPYHHYGYRKGQWYYALNILAELDSPGEWYLDREYGVLYFWPPSPIADGHPTVSVAPSLVSLTGVSHVTLQGLVLEAARGNGITISNGSHCLIAGCTLKNLGKSAVTISGGTDHGVVACDLYQLGDSGIALSGGDRKALTPARHYARNNHIHHYGRTKRMYSRAVSLNGVGNQASHNLIHDAPHQAISFGGNDHSIEFNEIHNVCLESNDAGAIYAGRNWTMRGTVIRHNFLHDITGFKNRGCVGVYLDDMFGGTEIVGNVFHRVTRAAFIGGGRDVTIANNIFVDCTPALHIDARALGWAHDHSDMWIKEGREKGTLSGIAYNQPPYRERYPRLVDILQDEPAAPKGNVVAGNVCVGGRWDDVNPSARPFIAFEGNLIDPDPGLVDAVAGDFQLHDKSPAWQQGFERIPIQTIGLMQDQFRTSLPIEE